MSTSSSSARSSRTRAKTSSRYTLPCLCFTAFLDEGAAAGAALVKERRGEAAGVDLDVAGGEADGVGDALGAGAAVADDGDPAQAKEDGAAGGVGMQLAPQPV